MRNLRALDIRKKLDKWWILEVFFEHLARTNKIITFNTKTRKAIKVPSKQLKLFYFNTFALIVSQTVVNLISTIHLLINDNKGSFSTDMDRILRLIFGFFFTMFGLLCINVSYSLSSRTVSFLQTYNSVFLYEAKVTSELRSTKNEQNFI
jgi:hypothetical protein